MTHIVTQSETYCDNIWHILWQYLTHIVTQSDTYCQLWQYLPQYCVTYCDTIWHILSIVTISATYCDTIWYILWQYCVTYCDTIWHNLTHIVTICVTNSGIYPNENQVSICAGANIYEPWAALLVGSGAGCVYAGVHSLMIRLMMVMMMVVMMVMMMVSSPTQCYS